MEKKHQVVLLPTDKESHLRIVTTDTMAHRGRKRGDLEDHDSPWTTNEHFSSQHLFILSDEEIKEVCWCYDPINKAVSLYQRGLLPHEYRDWRRIISSTDHSLDNLCGCKADSCASGPSGILPIPESFIQHYIEQYNKGNVITEVNVEYVDNMLYKSNGELVDPTNYPKLDKDGCIVINIKEKEPQFNYQEVDFEDNLPDLLKWAADGQLEALVDESKGGIIGYIHREHIDRITGLLNTKQETFTRA